MANKLREHREASGLNQRELAEKAHMPQSSVSELERGTRKPWRKAATRLSRALNIPVDDLFPEDFIKADRIENKEPLDFDTDSPGGTDGKLTILEFKQPSFENSGNLSLEFPVVAAKTDINPAIEARTEEVKKRLEAIESRFPKDATLDKIASVNDAILGTQVEALNESIHSLRDKMLTKWDVVVVVFETLGAIGIIVAIIFGIINFVRP